MACAALTANMSRQCVFPETEVLNRFGQALSRRRWLEAKDRDPSPDRGSFDAVVAVVDANMFGKGVQALVLAGLGDLRRDEVLVAELAFGMRLQVVVPLRVLWFTQIGGDQDRIGPIVEI